MVQNNKNKIIFVGFIAGFIFFALMNRGEKMKPLFFNSIIINFMNQKYHIHHWIIFLFLLIIGIIILVWKKCEYTNINAFLLGICLGSILHGLSYGDAFDIKIN